MNHINSISTTEFRDLWNLNEDVTDIDEHALSYLSDVFHYVGIYIYIIILLVRPYAYARSACTVRKHNESHAHALISA